MSLKSLMYRFMVLLLVMVYGIVQLGSTRRKHQSQKEKGAEQILKDLNDGSAEELLLALGPPRDLATPPHDTPTHISITDFLLAI
jgi:hypothetical protein